MLSFGFKSTGSQYLQHFYNNISHQVVGFYFGATALGAYRLAYEIALYPINWVIQRRRAGRVPGVRARQHAHARARDPVPPVQPSEPRSRAADPRCS